MKFSKFFVIFSLAGVILLSGCKSQPISLSAAEGAATGAVIGAGLGKLYGNTAVGTFSGALIGGTVSAIVSSHVKKAAKIKAVKTDSIASKVIK